MTDGTFIFSDGTASVVQWLACSHRVRYIVGSSIDRATPKTTKLVFVASPLSTQRKNLLARNHHNVSECDDMSIRELLFQ